MLVLRDGGIGRNFERDFTKIFVGIRDLGSSAGAGLLKKTWRDAKI